MFLSLSCASAEDNSTDLKEVNIDANDLSMYYHDGHRLNVDLSDDSEPLVNHSLTISINGQNYTRTTNDNGRASLAINLNPGLYSSNIYFLGTDQYLSSNKTVNVKVLPTISGEDIVKYYHNNTQYYATFLDSEGGVLDFENVTFNINGVFYTRTTNQNGVAKLNINLNSGDYILTAYNPNDGFAYSNNIKVLPTINGSDLKKIYRDNHQYWATFRDFKGNPLANTDVEFNIHGVFYTRKTNNLGNAKLNINLDAGTYIITARNLVTGEYCSNEIRVNAFSETKLSTRDYIFNPTDDDVIKATLTNALGYGVYGENINLAVDGKTYVEATDDNGVAKFYLNLSEGNYTLSFNHEANSRYGASSANSHVETYDGIKVSLKGESDFLFVNDTYSVRIYDENNKPFANQTVYFDFGYKVLSSISDDDGVASVKLDVNPNYYDLVYFFNSTGYKFTRGFSEIYVLSEGKTVLTPLISNVKEGNRNQFKVSLTVDGIILQDKEVMIEINGRYYNKTTDADGIASLTINLNAGNYIVNCYFVGDDGLSYSDVSSTLTVNPRIATKLTVITYPVYHKKYGFTYNVELRGDKLLSNREVVVTVGSKTFTQNTDKDGVVHLSLEDFNDGTYDVSFSFAGDNDYAFYKGYAKVTVTSKLPYAYGYWVRYANMYDINLPELASKGTYHLFLHEKAISAYGADKVVSWIKRANDHGIKVHIWMQAFYDGNWINPVNNDGSYKHDLFNSIIEDAKYYASLSGVGGVHLDYLRYPGTAYKYSNGANAISYLVKNVVSAVKAVNPNCIVSAAVMPEPSSMVYYYGQDIPTISKYLDAILPMVYKGNYERNTAWIQSTTKWFVSNSNGAQIWTGLQAYESDDNVKNLPVSELSGDAQAALNAGAKGVIMFRWGVCNFIDFNTLKTS